MNEKSTNGILWRKWLGEFTAVVWIVGTYAALLLGIVAASVVFALDTPRPVVVGAVAAVGMTTMLHWILFSMVECKPSGR